MLLPNKLDNTLETSQEFSLDVTLDWNMAPSDVIHAALPGNFACPEINHSNSLRCLAIVHKSVFIWYKACSIWSFLFSEKEVLHLYHSHSSDLCLPTYSSTHWQEAYGLVWFICWGIFFKSGKLLGTVNFNWGDNRPRTFFCWIYGIGRMLT